MPQRKLRVVGDEQPGAKVDLILIKGIGTCSVEEWGITSSQWRSILYFTDSKVRLLAFEFEIPLNDRISLENFFEEGTNLINCLSQHQEDSGETRPILFMCHSLGAFVLKHGLCIANAQSHTYATTLHAILGIIFLGSPHAALYPEELSEKSILILKSVPNNITRKGFARISKWMRDLAKVSRLFQDIELRLDILSLYETEYTNVKVGRREAKGLIGKRKKLRLVDERLVKTSTGREQCYGLAGDHAELCKLRQKDTREPDSRLQEWLKVVLSSTSLEIFANRLKCVKLPDSPHESFTSLSSYDAARISLAMEPANRTYTASRSNEATAGTGAIEKDWEIWPILSNFTSPRRSAKLPCFMMDTPQRNRDFFGRESVLRRLDEYLSPANSAHFSSEEGTQKHVVLCGMGGIGKTSIAIEFAFSRKDKFDAIFWVRADEPEKLQQDFGQIASKLGLEDPSEPLNPVISRQVATGWLANPKRVVNQDEDIVGQAEAHWLLIFDNADNPDILQDYWPLTASGSILVTSRDPLSKTKPSIASVSLDLEPFSDDEAALFLRRLSHVDREENLSLEIAKKLGGLPLAISQMAAIIQYQYLSFSEFLEHYEDDSDRKVLHAFNVEHPSAEARGNIASIWAIEQLEAQPRTLLVVLSILDPDCIQEHILTSDIPDDKHLDEYPKRGFSYSAARADLMRRSLVRRNEGNKELWIHRVLQDLVLTKTSKERKLMAFSVAVALVLTAWGKTPLEKRHDWKLRKSREGLFPHALSLKVTYEKMYRESNPRSGIDLGFLLSEAGWWQHERGNSHESKAFFKLALEICERNPCEDTKSLHADAHYGLAAACNETNEAEGCLKHTKVLLDLRLQALAESGKEDLRLAIAHNEIGISWVMNGLYANATSAFERSIEVFQGLEEYCLSIDTNPRTNMAFTYWLIGDLDKASQVFEDLLRDRISRFGLNDTESYRTGRVYHGLGNVRYDQGRLKESEELHRKALLQYQTTLGNNNHKTADLCHKLAQHLLRRGDLENARVLLDQALQTYCLNEKVFAPEIARTSFLKAKVAVQCGNNLEATVLFKEAKKLRNSVSSAPKKADATLREYDFDKMVTFYSR